MIRPTILLLLVALIGALATTPAEAQRRGRRAPPAAAAEDEPAGPQPTIADLDQIAGRLTSPNPDQVREAIDLLSVIDDPRVIPPLVELLRRGCTDQVTDRALQALGGLGHPSAIDTLVEFTRHRRTHARRLAYGALAHIDDPRIPALLEQGLRDSDRGIRAAAARALGDIGARGSVDTLFVAFDRGVIEAAIAIGKLGDRASIDRFSAHLGQVPLSVMLSGYQHYVRRSDIPEEVKVDIVNRLSEVSGPLVRAFLQRYLDTLPTRGRASRSAINRAVVETLRRIPGHAGSARGRVVSTDSEEAAEAAQPEANEEGAAQ